MVKSIGDGSAGNAKSNVSSICHLAGRGNMEEQGWNGSQGADRGGERKLEHGGEE